MTPEKKMYICKYADICPDPCNHGYAHELNNGCSGTTCVRVVTEGDTGFYDFDCGCCIPYVPHELPEELFEI